MSLFLKLLISLLHFGKVFNASKACVIWPIPNSSSSPHDTLFLGLCNLAPLASSLFREHLKFFLFLVPLSFFFFPALGLTDSSLHFRSQLRYHHLIQGITHFFPITQSISITALTVYLLNQQNGSTSRAGTTRISFTTLSQCPEQRMVSSGPSIIAQQVRGNGTQ